MVCKSATLAQSRFWSFGTDDQSLQALSCCLSSCPRGHGASVDGQMSSQSLS